MPAAFRLTTPAGQILTHVLAHPFVLDASPGRSATRYSRDSLDRSAREVITIGSGRAEFEATHRFDRLPWDLIDILSYAADGSKLTYYPDTAGPGWELWLIPTPELVALLQDPDRYGFGEYSVRLRFRDASTSGTSLEYLASPWLWRHRGGSVRRHGTFTRTGSVGAYRDIDGLLKQAAANVLRTTWREIDGVWRPLTLLEVPRTNAVSAALTSWGITNSGTWTGTTQGPDGVADSGKGIAHGSGGVQVRANNIPTGTPTDNTVQAVSVFAKAGDVDWCFIRVNRKNAATVWVYFDLANGVVGTDDPGITGYIEGPFVDGWYRCEATCDILSGGSTAQWEIGPADGDGDATMAGAGAPYVYFFGPQWEMDAPEPSSFIGSAGASRGAEAFSDAFPYTPAQLAAMGGATIYLDYIVGLSPPWQLEGGAHVRPIHIGNASGGAPNLSLLLPAGSGGDHRLSWDNGPSAVTSDVNLSVARGDRIQVAAQLIPSADAKSLSARLLARQNGVTNAAGSQSPELFASSAFSGQLVHVGGVGTLARGIQEYADAIVFPAPLDIDECEERAA